ncbi:hypothetical protein M514_11748 [Trichuris suis]|uniref:Reverse transcriptase domain-containing protein n=1 Tax=Trichuris suis TaxID=68888 RepID=A0A085MVX8_9BILA|nr:hypothetical protein M513_11748 [Trichuris suis]KFD61374.1 hypothetical protein M514_11748 [Trichuris suis]
MPRHGRPLEKARRKGNIRQMAFMKSSAACFVAECNSADLVGVELTEKLGMYKQPMDAEHGLTNESQCSNGATGHLDFGSHNDDSRCAEALPSQSHASSESCHQPNFSTKTAGPLYAALPDVDRELDRLERNGVLSKVNYSNWAASIVVNKRNGPFRISADFSTGINDALQLHQYPLPLPEDIITILNVGAFFSCIDFADAYLQIEVDEQSGQLITVNTHRGLYR